VSAYGISRAASLNCRKGPGQNYEIVKTYLLGDDIEIVCQVYGQKIYETDIWDYTPDKCFVSDYYVSTGYTVIFKDLCSSGSKTSTTKKASASSKPTPTKATRTVKPTSEFGSIEEDGSSSSSDDESSTSIKMTKITPSSSNESPDFPTSFIPIITLSTATKPNSA
ncbi:hypothetical protein GGI12_005630, partial [Dipsacomyces acuminosporus]